MEHIEQAKPDDHCFADAGNFKDLRYFVSLNVVFSLPGHLLISITGTICL